MHVLYVGPFGQSTGYGQACNDYLLALHRHGVSLDIRPLAPLERDFDRRYEELLPLMGLMKDEKPTHVVVHTVPAAAIQVLSDLGDEISGAKHVVVTTWETDEMPDFLVEQLMGWFDKIIVPSEFCAAAVESSPMVEVVPHCYEPSHWRNLHWRQSLDSVYTYRFYSVLNWGERKNPIGLLKSYLSEFSAEDAVSLTIKLPPGTNPRPDVEALYDCLGYPIEEAPALRFEMEQFSHEEMVQFHLDHDCFVTAARGEGWNLPAFEAAIVGNAIISPDWGGHLEFCRDLEGYAGVNFNLTPVAVPPQLGASVAYGNARLRVIEKVAPHGLSIRQRWCEPDLAALGWEMRRAAGEGRRGENPSTRYGLDEFTYENIAKRFVEALER